MPPMTLEELCAELRADIKEMCETTAALHDSGCFRAPNVNEILARGNVPTDKHGNMHANITLAFRHLEDARMRLGKVLQASQGGVSILDK